MVFVLYLNTDYGFEIPDLFVVGYALDYNEYFRDLNVSFFKKKKKNTVLQGLGDCNLPHSWGLTPWLDPSSECRTPCKTSDNPEEWLLSTVDGSFPPLIH